MPPPDRRPPSPPAPPGGSSPAGTAAGPGDADADATALLGASARLFRPAALARRLAARPPGRLVRVPLAHTGTIDLLLALLGVAALVGAWLAAEPSRLLALLRLAGAALGGDGG